MYGRSLFSPKEINAQIAEEVNPLGWRQLRRGSTEIDFYKDRVGIEIQFGKYAFLSHDEKKLLECFYAGLIDRGIIVAPGRELASQMSSGVACAENHCASFRTTLRRTPMPLTFVGIGYDLPPMFLMPMPAMMSYS